MSLIGLILFTAALSKKKDVLVPWKAIQDDPDKYVDCVEGVVIDWSEPSRAALSKIEANWRACEGAQTTLGPNGERLLQIPFEFKPKILETMRKGKSKY